MRSVVRSRAPFHGTSRQMRPLPTPEDSGLFAGVAGPFGAAVYHSLVVDPAQLRQPWRVTATDELDEVAAIERHVPGEEPAYGLQFHPESYLSDEGDRLRRNWLSAISRWRLTIDNAPVPRS